MKKFLSFISATILAGIAGCCTSCNSEDPYIDIIAATSCSPDLLEFVVPIVTISGENGESRSFELSASDFKETKEGGSITINVNVNGESTSISSTAVNNVAECIKRFETESIKGDIMVSYKLNPGYSINKEKYVFFHNVCFKYTSMSKEGLKVSSSSIIKPIAYEIEADKVEEYIHTLISEGDKTTFSVTTAQAVK